MAWSGSLVLAAFPVSAAASQPQTSHLNALNSPSSVSKKKLGPLNFLSPLPRWGQRPTLLLSCTRSLKFGYRSNVDGCLLSADMEYLLKFTVTKTRLTSVTVRPLSPYQSTQPVLTRGSSNSLERLSLWARSRRRARSYLV